MFTSGMPFTSGDADMKARLALAGNPVVQGEHCRPSFVFIIPLLTPPDLAPSNSAATLASVAELACFLSMAGAPTPLLSTTSWKITLAIPAKVR